jgi:hypothetical protein
MWSCGGQVGIASTVKDTKMGIRWLCAVESKKWRMAI